MRLRLASRGSDLAVLQATLVKHAIEARWPDADVTLVTRSSQGDRDQRVALWDAADKGLFTQDLSQLLLDGGADLVVHSWKDLPIVGLAGTTIAGTIERADPRDVLLLRQSVVRAEPSSIALLSSSPRRVWQMQQSLAPLLPWAVTSIAARPVRGNISTRVQKLLAGEADGLVVAKAALDRLLSPTAPPQVSSALRAALASCAWMVLPLKDFPTAPAQGALAIEVAEAREDVRQTISAISHAPTREAVEAERAILASHGGGCHEAIGATVRVREYGRITSVRGQLPSGEVVREWSLAQTNTSALPPRADAALIFPRPEERKTGSRRALPVTIAPEADALWVSRADALPSSFRARPAQLIWTAGLRTWEKLAERGVWVHGSAEGLGDQEPADVDLLAGRSPRWRRLTHDRSELAGAIATYAVDFALPEDLGARTHFFWTSGSQFLEALRRHPEIRDGWHSSGPGRTSQVIREALGAEGKISIWLEYEEWLRTVKR